MNDNMAVGKGCCVAFSPLRVISCVGKVNNFYQILKKYFHIIYIIQYGLKYFVVCMIELFVFLSKVISIYFFKNNLHPMN